MTHTFIQDWLFAEPESLSPSEAGELQQHLLECPECRAQSRALTEAERCLRSQPLLSPAKGFTARWQARLQAERDLRHRRQTSLVVGISLSSIVTLFGTLMLYLWPWMVSYETVIWAFLYQFYWIYQFLAAVGEFLTRLFLAVSVVFPPVLLLFVVGMMFELGVLWIVSYRFLTNPRRIEVS